MKKFLTLALTLVLLLGLLSFGAFAQDSETGYGYDETPAQKVSIYVTFSNDGMPIQGTDKAKTKLSHLSVEIPYFDLANYELDEFYRYATEDGQGAYVGDEVIERPTALHAYIYLIERFYLGLPEDECGTGESGLPGVSRDVDVLYMDDTLAFNGKNYDALSITGSPTSLYMQNFWGHDENLMYFRNHVYPLMSAGWGSTADYILLSDGDTIDLAMFSDWQFWTNGAFCQFDQDEYTLEPGQLLTASTFKAGTFAVGDGSSPELAAVTDLDVAVYDESWKKIADLSGSGVYNYTFENEGTYYLLGTDSKCKTGDACYAPATAKVTVQRPGYLSELRLTSAFSAGDCAFTPAFDSETFAYNVAMADQMGNGYLWATLSENAPADATITAEWTNHYNGKQQTTTITSGKASGQSLANLGRDGKTNTITVTVGTGDDQQSYRIDTYRTPTLTSLGVTGANMNETYSYSREPVYTADTTGESATIRAVPYNDSYTVTYNGSSSNTVALELGANPVEIVVSNGKDETSYTLTITRHAVRALGITAEPEDALIYLLDPYNARVLPNDEGAYEVADGYTYRCNVTASGYVAQQETFTVSDETTDLSFKLEKAAANEKINAEIPSTWPNFRNGENNLGITDAKTPYTPEDTELLWAEKYGTGWAAAPGSPILVDDCIVTYVGSTIKKLDVNTGKVVAEAPMVASSSFSIVPATYADGMIFVGLSGGRVQAFNADTLESLWVYTDPLGGQPNCPITYKDGYLYIGYWNSETKSANFACISATDEDPTQETEAKLASWAYSRLGGFYWAGAYVTDRYVLVGTDDGQSGSMTESSSLLVLNRADGTLVDSWDGIRGDIRSNVSYDPDSERFFFTSKGGVLCNFQIDWETGKILNTNSVVIVDSQGNEYAMSTCTPSVYNGRIYIGVSGKSQFGASSGHAINVYDFDGDGVMTRAYSYDIVGYPQTSAMLTTAYMEDEECVYIYLPYNMTPGGISVLRDRPGQTEPEATTDTGYSEIFTPVAPLAQYCICSTIADEYGTVYYKNDSCYMMALTSRIEGIEITRLPTSLTRLEDGTYTAEGLQVVARLANGLTRDVSDYVTVEERDGRATVVYTYGFDHANYGLKEKTVAIHTEAKVDITAVAEGAYLMAPQTEVTVASNLAEHYGYTDSVDLGSAVSALDVLVKAHELVFGEDFTAETAPALLVVNEYGYVSTLFGMETSANGFMVNHMYPHDGTESPYGGYNGYSVSTMPIASGDLVEFFLYQDTTTWSDTYAWLLKDGVSGRSFTGKVGIPLNLTVKGASVMMGYTFKDLNAMLAAGTAISGAQLALVNPETGALTDLEGAVTDETGAVSLTFTTPGVYTITVYMPEDAIAAGSAPVILSLTELTVEGYAVTLGEGLSGAAYAAPGESYTFCLEERDDNYDYFVSALMGGESTPVVENEDGTYTVSNVTAELELSVSRTLRADHSHDLSDCVVAADGSHSRTCSLCEESFPCEVITDEAVPATCTEAGLTEGSHCAVCGKAIVAQETVNPLGHSTIKLPGTPATCTEAGTEDSWKCTVCGKLFSDEKGETEITAAAVIPATGHKLEKVNGTPATCTEAGTEDSWKCTACGKLFSDEKGETEITAAATLPATGHSFVDGECTVCHAADPDWEEPFVNPFIDVKESDWFYPYVMEMAKEGVINGYSDHTFRPNVNLTRAEMVTLLYRASGSPEVSGNASFTDVPANAWYLTAVTWAEEKGVVNGVGNGEFEPEEDVSREQLVTMLWRLAGKPESDEDLNAYGFEDVAKVNSWAKTAMQWAVANKIVNGTTFTGKPGTYLAPQDSTTRAEAAKILCVYLEMN